jgi:hypothetical protein
MCRVQRGGLHYASSRFAVQPCTCTLFTHLSSISKVKRSKVTERIRICLTFSLTYPSFSLLPPAALQEKAELQREGRHFSYFAFEGSTGDMRWMHEVG